MLPERLVVLCRDEDIRISYRRRRSIPAEARPGCTQHHGRPHHVIMATETQWMVIQRRYEKLKTAIGVAMNVEEYRRRLLDLEARLSNRTARSRENARAQA